MYLTCYVSADNGILNPITRWRLPNEAVINFGVGNNVFQYNVAPPAMTYLLIQNMTYEDAGTYTCEARNTSDTTTPTVWYSATVELQLLGTALIIDTFPHT